MTAYTTHIFLLQGETPRSGVNVELKTACGNPLVRLTHSYHRVTDKHGAARIKHDLRGRAEVKVDGELKACFEIPQDVWLYN